MPSCLNRALGDLSIRYKLIVITTVTSSMALALALGIFIALDLRSFRQSMAADIESTTEMVGTTTTAALAFSDDHSARAALAALAAKDHVTVACLYAENGKLFASYRRSAQVEECPASPPRAAGARFESRRLWLVQPVQEKQRVLGSLYVASDVSPFWERVRWHGWIALAVLATCFLAVLAIATPLQRTIATPILELAETMRSVTRARSFDVRAPKERHDEIGTLIDGFNEMLTEIQDCDAMLHAHQEHLEEQGRRAPRNCAGSTWICSTPRTGPKTPTAPRASSSPT